MQKIFKFEINAKDNGTLARAGTITTKHGVIQTPIFMPVGTRATVKAIAPDDLEKIGAQIVLSNTYHLMLRPGEDLIKDLGGLHKFMAWPGPILTDSGGFQAFSLSKLRKITEEGITFNSPYDGSKTFFTPERSIEVQQTLGVDIMMCLDECTGYPASRIEALESMNRSRRWAERCKKVWEENKTGALFGISQGSFYPDLRKKSAEDILELDLPGHAVGGLALGEPFEDRIVALEAAREVIPENKPMYLMGMGTPIDMIESIKRGADMFDCVMPTRNARNGQFFTSLGRLSIRNAKFKKDETKIDENCTCYTCQKFSKAYLRHLIQNDEPLYVRLASIHNLTYYLTLVREIRKSLMENNFLQFYNSFYENLEHGKTLGLVAV